MPVPNRDAPQPGEKIMVRSDTEATPAVILRARGNHLIIRFDAPDAAAKIGGIATIVRGNAEGADLFCTRDPQHASEDPAVVALRTHQRETFRVRLGRAEGVARLPDGRRTPIVDISFGGLAVRVPEPPPVGSRLNLGIACGDGARTADFVVQNARAAATGGYTCGLALAEGQPEVREWLHESVMRIQRARLAGKPAGPATAEPPKPKAPKGAGRDADPEHDPRAPEADRRAHPREAVRRRIVAQVVASQRAPALEAQTIDISRSGLAITTARPLTPGTCVMVILSDRDRKPWILARVVHCAPVAGEHHAYRVGLRFAISGIQQWEAPDPGDLVTVAGAVAASQQNRPARTRREPPRAAAHPRAPACRERAGRRLRAPDTPHAPARMSSPARSHRSRPVAPRAYAPP
jgi:hypothetical protein